MIDELEEFIYNLIHYCLSLEQRTAPLSYSVGCASFSIYDPDSFHSKDFLGRVPQTFEKIKEVGLLFSFSDPRSVYLDQVPTLEEDLVFRYNPLFAPVDLTEDFRDKARQKINSLNVNKKSRSLRFCFDKPRELETS